MTKMIITKKYCMYGFSAMTEVESNIMPKNAQKEEFKKSTTAPYFTTLSLTKHKEIAIKNITMDCVKKYLKNVKL